MTGIVIARRDGTLKNDETGERYRLVKGRTLADAGHPAVKAYPEAFMPVSIDLRADEADVPAGTDDELALELREVTEQRDSMLATLQEIVAGLAERGIVDPDNLPSDVGWLSRVVFDHLDSAEADPAQLGDADVKPPSRSRRKPQA